MAIAPGPGPNPNSKRPVWILDFGFWISDFGFWILDFGFWILDFGFWISDFGFGFWISLVFVLFVAAPNGPVWILDFGFWILDFGFWILDFGLGLGSIDTVWILHKISTSHADSGRRIYPPLKRTANTPAKRCLEHESPFQARPIFRAFAVSFGVCVFTLNETSTKHFGQPTANKTSQQIYHLESRWLATPKGGRFLKGYVKPRLMGVAIAIDTFQVVFHYSPGKTQIMKKLPRKS